MWFAALHLYCCCHRALRFPHACFSCVLMVICLVSMSPDGHIGTKLLAAYQLLGEAWLGALTAGAMVRPFCACSAVVGPAAAWVRGGVKGSPAESPSRASPGPSHNIRHVGPSHLNQPHPSACPHPSVVVVCVQVSIAKPLAAVHQGAYIALLCLTTCLGLGLLTSARAGPAAITLW